MNNHKGNCLMYGHTSTNISGESKTYNEAFHPCCFCGVCLVRENKYTCNHCCTEWLETERRNEMKENQKNKEIVEKIRELVEEKEGWLRVNAYRITQKQKDLVWNEIKELKKILGETG